MLTDFYAGWYVAFGFAPSAGGALCYYGPGTNKYDRSLVQFIPRWVPAQSFNPIVYLLLILLQRIRVHRGHHTLLPTIPIP
jgi:hypothetical protein